MEHYKSDKFWCIYAHINKINGKIYIGISKDTKNRWQEGRGYKNCRYFYYAVQKYGWDMFDHIILITDLSKELADIAEINLIKKYDTTNSKNGYNLASGGSGVVLKGKHNPLSIPVYQYDLRGNFIKEWENATIVHQETGIDNYEIGLSAKTPGARHAGRYLWSYEKHDKIEVFRDFRGLYAKVYQFDLDGNIINIYNNLHEVDKKKINKVRESCKSGVARYSSIWLFEEDYTKQNIDKIVQEIRNKSYLKGKPVRMYSLDGIYITTFPNANFAAKETGLEYGAIVAASRGVNASHRTNKYLWYYEEDMKDDQVDAWNNTRRKMVYQFDLNGLYIRSFESLTEAKKMFGTTIGNVIRNKHIAYGYFWIYQEEYDDLKEKYNLQDL